MQKESQIIGLPRLWAYMEPYWRQALLLSLLALIWQPAVVFAAQGKVSLDLSYVGIGIGYHSGTATVQLGGKTAHYDVSGFQLLGAGFSTFHADGTVTGARSIDDIAGKYSVIRGSISVIVGGVTLSVHNDHGVTMDLKAGTTKGIDFSAGPGDLTFTRSGGVSKSGAQAKASAKPAGMTMGGACVSASGGPLPHIGLYAYTHAHATNPNPPDRWGGPVTITAAQTKGAVQWVLPGPREMDLAVFGTPNHPVGWEQAPFPLIGIPPKLRQSANGKYTIVNHATPFSNWRAIGVGDVKMSITDITAIDGAKTKDKVDFVATFESPDKMHGYKVVVKKALPHGFGYPFFGGVVTDHLMHGGTAIGTRLMPTEYIYASFWGAGDIYVDGRLTNPNQIVHMMIGEGVRGKRWALGHDKDIHGSGVVMHLMVPPYKVTPKGPMMAPLRSGYIPFPEIKKRMMKAKAMVMKMSPEKQKMMMPKLMATKALMMKTKKHVQEMMAEGKMFGQPFFHVMFGNVKYKVKH